MTVPEESRDMILYLRPYLNLLILVALLALPGCAGVLDLDGALAVTPYRIGENGRIVIDVRVNGEGPFDFALDTGASISAVFDRLNDKLAAVRKGLGDLSRVTALDIAIWGFEKHKWTAWLSVALKVLKPLYRIGEWQRRRIIRGD